MKLCYELEAQKAQLCNFVAKVGSTELAAPTST